MSIDKNTAQAFANSWNNLPAGSVYTQSQFEDWIDPLTRKDIAGKTVLEMGCGNASLLVHMSKCEPSYLEGVDLGDSVKSAINNMNLQEFKNWKIKQGDLTEYKTNGFDLVYCIGVLHHLKDPKKGLDSIINNVKTGGRFHCWVYAKEGNGVVIRIVDPIRKVVSKLPWWFTKYLVATPIVVPYFIYAKTINAFKSNKVFKKLPLYDYSVWIAQRDFLFFRHVAFDQFVTPQTIYISKSTIEQWLSSYKNIDQASTYIIMRNGNSWKFGARVK